MKKLLFLGIIFSWCSLFSNPLDYSLIPTSKAASKKILFIMPYFSLGGTEWAFLHMLNLLPPIHSYTLCIMTRGGVLEQFVKRDIEIISWQKAQRKYFDVAISYAHWVTPPVWASKIHAMRKIQWIHVDLKGVRWTPEVSKSWLSIDDYVVTSDKARESFNQVLPQLASKSCTIYNLVDSERIRKQANEPIADMSEGDGILNVVSVCRLDWIKALPRALAIHKRLDEEGILFRWYIIGEGSEHKMIERLIQQNNMQGKFILLGQRLNPHPYMKKADIFAALSYSESFSLVLAEAKILKRPIFVTNFSGASEQIASGIDGLICENNEEVIYQGLKQLLTRPLLRIKFSQALRSFEYDNSTSLKKIEELFSK
jgi:glycosyltransferase involved in cell wall biosynthesis